MRSLLMGLMGTMLLACSSQAPEPALTATVDPAATAASGPASEPASDGGTAYFAGGCFWGVEHYMEQIDGVLGVESGYMGGHVESPSYEDVLGHESGHLEAVRVRFDPARVSYQVIAKRFFEIHDPTQQNGQGPDIGPQYLSAVFYTSPEQKQTTQALIETLEGRGYDVATELRPAQRFWVAEDYHQDYYTRTGKQPYCHTRVNRFGD